MRKLQAAAGGATYTVGASYDSAGHMTAMTYPSGAIVTWLRDATGRINRVDAVPVAGGAQTTVVSTAAYLPFGPLTQLVYGNGRALAKTFDQNYSPTGVADDASTQPLTLGFSLNPVGNITGIAEHDGSAIAANDYAYDGLDRLSAKTQGGTTLESFGYDATGNRLNKNGAAYSYSAGSHRLDNAGGVGRSYDANGNSTAIGAQALVYNDRGRLAEYKPDGVTTTHRYAYNGKGERVRKDDVADPLLSRDYVYDEAGHLIGEYTLAGARIKEYVWMDEQLVAVLSDHDGTNVQHVETDHLGTPRRVVNPATNETIWRWDLNTTAFGEHAPGENPDGDALAYTFNLRYPGQYFDAESGLHYNYFRDYEPGTGRYVQSDPIGLDGGMSTYGYVGGSPLSGIDPYGLWKWGDEIPQPIVDDVVGLGSGALQGLTFGLIDPSAVGIDTSHADKCSYGFRGTNMVGSFIGGYGTGGAIGKYGIQGLRYLPRSLNGVKGIAGEVFSFANNQLKGSTFLGRQVGIQGFTTIADQKWRSAAGLIYYVESKFGTSGLTRAQRVARKALGSQYVVEAWTYPWLGGAAGKVGSLSGGAVGVARSECGCQ